MRTSRFLLATLREVPADAELISHRLMVRAGMIRSLAAGLYTWLPMGLRVLHKVESIVREEMDRAGAQELLMSAVQPAELWQETGRWGQFGPELQRFSDRHGRDFCLGPTHEEIITDLVRREIRSYKQLPVCFYQIQTKFRDEVRPRFGIMRAREFLMKDAYSFHLGEESLQETYQCMFDSYSRIFTRLGLHFRAVLADSGNIGGAISHEFHALAESGEDEIVFSGTGDYAANVERAETLMPEQPRPSPGVPLQHHDTPGQRSIAELSRELGVPASQCVKTLVVAGTGGSLVALVLRGDHELNVSKAEKLEQVAAPLCMADAELVAKELGCPPGSLGPVGLQIPVFADYGVATLADFVCGANQEARHLSGVNWQRDLPEPSFVDLRRVQPNDPAPDGSGPLQSARGIEVGHIFQLGDRYSRAMSAVCLDEQGEARTLVMGCYGIGISRIVAAVIEQSHDARGIIWPQHIAPFQLVLVPMNMHKSARLRHAVMAFYEQLQEAGIEVLLDDRRERPGVMFADAELTGIPHRFVMSERGLDAGEIEYQARRGGEKRYLPQAEALSFLQTQLSQV